MNRMELALEPKLATELRAVPRVLLSPGIEMALKTALTNYATAKRHFEEAERMVQVCKTDVQTVFDRTGETTIAVDGATVTLVAPVTNKLDPKRLIMQGVTMAQIENATTTTPGTPYLRITLPKEKR